MLSFVRAGCGGRAPFVVPEVVAQGFVEVDFNKYFARWGLVIFLKVQILKIFLKF